LSLKSAKILACYKQFAGIAYY